MNLKEIILWLMTNKVSSEVRFRLIPRYIIVDKTGKIVLYRAIETDFDKINETLAALK
jgi:hypothetical protein